MPLTTCLTEIDHAPRYSGWLANFDEQRPLGMQRISSSAYNDSAERSTPKAVVA